MIESMNRDLLSEMAEHAKTKESVTARQKSLENELAKEKAEHATCKQSLEKLTETTQALESKIANMTKQITRQDADLASEKDQHAKTKRNLLDAQQALAKEKGTSQIQQSKLQEDLNIAVAESKQRQEQVKNQQASLHLLETEVEKQKTLLAQQLKESTTAIASLKESNRMLEQQLAKLSSELALFNGETVQTANLDEINSIQDTLFKTQKLLYERKVRPKSMT